MKIKLLQIITTLKCRSDIVWKEASTKISDKLSPDTLNFYVRTNRWNLRTNLRKHFNIIVEEEEREVMDISSESNISQEFQPFSFVENNNKLPKFWFDLSLSKEQWKSISPISKIYKEKGTKGKTYKVLNIGWTDIISEACFLKNKLPCAYVNMIKFLNLQKQKHI